MTAARLTLGLLLATVAIAATACGGGSDSVPSDAVAVVDGTEISKAELDEFMSLSKKRLRAEQAGVPEGRDARVPEHPDAATSRYLVELAQFQQAADDLGVKVTEKDIDKVENQTIETSFGGKRADYEKALRSDRRHAEQYRRRTAYACTALYDEDLRRRHEGRRRVGSGDPRVLHREPVAVRVARVARRAAHPHRREGQGRQGRLRGQQGEGRRGVRAAEGRRRLRGARQADLRRSGQQGLGREADDLARPDRSRVRQGRVRAQDGRALEAGEDAVRLPRDRGRLRRSEGDARRPSTRSGRRSAPRSCSRSATRRCRSGSRT